MVFWPGTAYMQPNNKGPTGKTCKPFVLLASPSRFERPAPSLGGKCSILLSYGDKNSFYTLPGGKMQPPHAAAVSIDPHFIAGMARLLLHHQKSQF
jgi:hypothetical protein